MNVYINFVLLKMISGMYGTKLQESLTPALICFVL